MRPAVSAEGETPSDRLGPITEPYDGTPECPLSERVDGPLHSWRFDGDDPYVECVYCGEYRDARTGWVIRHGQR